MAPSPRLKLSMAIARATDRQSGWMPYFHSALVGLIRVESTEVPTLAVSKYGQLYWNAGWVNKNSIEIVAMGLIHEVMHVTLRHHERAEALGIKVEPGAPVSEELQRKAALANLAEDACINEQLRAVQVVVKGSANNTATPLPLPTTWIYPQTLNQQNGLTMEQRYRLLLQNPPKDGEDGVGEGACGSCAGHPTEGETAGAEAKASGRSVAELDRMRRTIAGDVRAFVAKGRGTVPDGLQKWADTVLAPAKIDWRAHLRQAVRSAIAYRTGSVSLTWQRPSRRQGGVGYGIGVPVLPGLHAPVPRVGIILDTSGSMGGGKDSPLAQAVSEIGGILRDVGAQVTVVACDAAVHGVRECRTLEEACSVIGGGGGTVMTPGFEALAVHRPRPEVVICVTDGHIGDGYPAEEPNYCKAVWCVVGGNKQQPCPWGETIFVDDVKEEAA